MRPIVVAPDSAALGVRDPLYAPRRIVVEERADGSVLISNPTPVGSAFETALGPVEYWAARTPTAPWLAERSGEGWRIVSYAEAWQRIGALAGGLADLGMKSGAPLLVLARNGIDHALVTYAAMSQGTPVAAVSPQYGLAGADLGRLAHAAALIGPGAVLVDDAAAFAGALAAPFLAGLPAIGMRRLSPGQIDLASLTRATPAPVIANGDDIARLLLTSGSTGPPKAVICLHRGVSMNAAQVTACYLDDEPPVVVNQAPWSHSLGAIAVLQMVTQRGGFLYIDAGAPVAGRHGETVRNLSDIAPTYHNMVPAGWDLLAGELERDETLAKRFFSRVRVLQYGGAALAQSTCDRIQAVARATVGEAISFASGYGATETGPTATNVHWPNLTMGLMGLPTPGTTVKLVPTEDRLEFRVRGPQVSPGYYRNPTATEASRDEEGFYRLGDAARPVDARRWEQGLRFDGRLSENFKLSSGTFVNAGGLRVAALSAIGGAAADAVVCGENQAMVGLLVFLNRPFCQAIGAGDPPHACEKVRAAVAEGLARYNASAGGSGGRVARAMLLDDAPHAASGEITDKGYINQALARTRRAAAVQRLFAVPPNTDVLTI